MSADSFMNSILIREKGPIRTEGLQKMLMFNQFCVCWSYLIIFCSCFNGNSRRNETLVAQYSIT